MSNQLYINDVDASTHKVFMGEGFLNKILAPCEMKNYITNDSALEHGKRYIASNPKMQERSLTLTFNIHGDTQSEFIGNMAWLQNIFYGGEVRLKIPAISESIYRLIYTGKSIAYNQDVMRLNGTITAGFVEPDPTDRTNTYTAK